MDSGTVVRFDEVRGYGFIAPDGGGEDVFMHVNDLRFDKRLLGRGVPVEFDIEEGERGLKASRIGLVTRATERPDASIVSVNPQSPTEDEVMCDVLSLKEFLEEVTEGLLDVAPGITAEQVLHVRQRMAQVAHKHGWVDS